MDAGYQTAAREAEDAFVERRSRFIGAICPVQTEEDALAFVAKRKKAHWDATHHVYAYVLRQEGIRRYSDDGEPQGTAGMPVLDVLLKEALSDCVVVVTRYFGGILLGGGGLVRAYSHGASLAVAAGGLQVMRLCDIVRLSCSYGQYGWVAPLIAEQGGVPVSYTHLDVYKRQAQFVGLSDHLVGRLAHRLFYSVPGLGIFSLRLHRHHPLGAGWL